MQANTWQTDSVGVDGPFQDFFDHQEQILIKK